VYRLLEVGEVIENGDEIWADERWSSFASNAGEKKLIARPVRRLVKPAVTPAASSVPDPGEGYRLIDKAVDKPEKGDEIWNEDHWEVRGHWFDCKAYNKNNIYRRKLPAVPAADTNEGYRMLSVGEKLRAGDEIYVGKWEVIVPALVGTTMKDWDSSQVRRRIPQPAPVVSVGDRVKVLSGPWAGCTGVVIALDAYVLLSDYGKMTAKYDSTPVIELDHVRVGGQRLTVKESKVEKLPPAPPVVPEVLYRDLSHGETIRVEDEFLFCGNWRAGSTEPRHIGNKLEKWHVRHRRPVRLQSPGWRYLDAGETVQSGDEIARSKVWKWIQCSDSVGKPLTDDYLEHGVYVIRRKLPTISGG